MNPGFSGKSFKIKLKTVHKFHLFLLDAFEKLKQSEFYEGTTSESSEKGGATTSKTYKAGSIIVNQRQVKTSTKSSQYFYIITTCIFREEIPC